MEGQATGGARLQGRGPRWKEHPFSLLELWVNQLTSTKLHPKAYGSLLWVELCPTQNSYVEVLTPWYLKI